MSNEIVKKQTDNFLSAIAGVIAKLDLDDVKTFFDAKSGVVSVTGNKNGIQYTTTLTKMLHGFVQTTSQFDINMGKEVLIEQIKALRKQGLTQQKIATMLNISQATVSKYLHK